MKAAALGSLAVLASGKVYFKETFDEDWLDRWVHSDWKKKAGNAGTFSLDTGKWFVDEEKNKGLSTPVNQDSKFYTIAAKIPEPFSNEGKDLIIQYQLKYEKDLECGGGYIKIGPTLEDLSKFEGETAYNIMFGPDKCGYQKRTHLIFSHNGKNALKTSDLEYKQDDIGVSSLYTLIVKPDNTVTVKVDKKEIYSGSLEEDWALLPPKKIDDPEDKKPADWVDTPMMDDPEDVKPADWVEEEDKEIPDPEAEQPDDWNEEEDGKWEAEMVPNPNYKGPWYPKQIENPEFVGAWTPKQKDNPEYEPNAKLYAYKDFGFIGVDVWQVKAGAIFDNFIITDDEAEAEKLADEWEALVTYEKEMKQEEIAQKAEKAKADTDEDLAVQPDIDELDDDEDL